MRNAGSRRRGLIGLALALALLTPGLASAQVTIRQGAFSNGDGFVHVIKDSTGVGVILSGNVGGSSPTGTVSAAGTTISSRSGIRLTNVLSRVQEFDDNTDGNIERTTFTFEAPVTNATDPSGIKVGEGTGAAVSLVSGDGKTVTVSVSGASGTERKTVRYTAKAGVLTDARGNSVLFWPATGRKTTLCGTVTSKGDCFAQVEQDRAKPQMGITEPDPLDKITESFSVTYTLSENVKAAASAPVTFSRVRGDADGAAHSSVLAQVAKGNGASNYNGTSLGLVEGAGYRISANVSDNADVGDPYTTTPNTNTASVTNVIYTKGTAPTFFYVKAGSSGPGNGTAASPYPTIAQGITRVAGSGGKVLVLEGNYSEAIQMPSNVELRGIGPDLVKLSGPSGCAVLFNRVSNSELTGFTVEGAQSSSSDPLRDSAVCVVAGTGISVHNNILKSSRNGVRVEESNPVLRRNTMTLESTHGATMRYPAAGFDMQENVVVAPNGGTCIYLEIPPASAAASGTLVKNNALFPVNCGSVSARAGLAGVNTFVNPALNADFVATGAPTRGWNVGPEGVSDIVTVQPPVINAMSTAGLILAVVAALFVASFVFRRKGGDGRPR